VVEVDEDNNERGATIVALTPDLTIRELTWSEGVPPGPGKVVFSVVVENGGDGRAESSMLAFYVDDELEEEREIAEVAAGATVTEDFYWSGKHGTYEVKVTVDEADTVAELDEANNELIRDFTTPTPDLAIGDVAWSQQSGRVNFTVMAENRGDGWAGTNTLAYFIGGVLVGEQEIEELGAGANVTRTFTWQGNPGSHQVEVIADNGLDITESDEDNNARLLTVALAAANPAPSRNVPLDSTAPEEKEIMWGIWIPVILAGCAIGGWVVFGLLKFRG
jgi:subtilase family serine protease